MAAPTIFPDVETETESEVREDRKYQPPYHVILLNDDDHSFEYVISMLKELFAHPVEKGFKMAQTVHETGRAIVLTTTLEHAELKQDQKQERKPHHRKSCGEKSGFAQEGLHETAKGRPKGTAFRIVSDIRA